MDLIITLNTLGSGTYALNSNLYDILVNVSINGTASSNIIPSNK